MKATIHDLSPVEADEIAETIDQRMEAGSIVSTRYEPATGRLIVESRYRYQNLARTLGFFVSPWHGGLTITNGEPSPDTPRVPAPDVLDALSRVATAGTEYAQAREAVDATLAAMRGATSWAKLTEATRDLQPALARLEAARADLAGAVSCASLALSADTPKETP